MVPRGASRLHITHGDSAAEGIRRTAVGGDVVALRDQLHDGPASALAGEAWRELRARYLEAAYDVPYPEALRSYEAEDAAVDAAAGCAEVVLWFDHELLDQLHLARTLARLPDNEYTAGRPRGRGASAAEPAITLVCIDRHPGVEPFIGLGQLDPEQLAALFPSRVELSAPAREAGRLAWDAYTAADPTAVERLAAGGATGLAFLAPALRRHLEEFPSTRDGLPRTECEALQALLPGASTPDALFRAVQARERWLFMGDWSFWHRVQALGGGAHPLVRIRAEPEPGPGLPSGDVELTDVGRAVLAGTADAVSLNGFDRWLGGVHLRARGGELLRWRWDPVAGRLVSP